MSDIDHIRVYLEHVLPQGDVSVFTSIATYDPVQDRWGGLSTKGFSGTVAMAEWFMRKKGVDTFAVLSTQREAREAIQGGNSNWFSIARGAANAVAFQCLIADIDLASPKHPDLYASRDDALRALWAFCAAISMPLPTLMVNSGGGGLHVYWRCEVELLKDKWLQLSAALASAMRIHKLKADVDKTVDANIALRVPTSRNHKYNPGIVRMLAPPGPAIPLATLEQVLDPFRLKAAPAPLPGNADFGAGIVTGARPVPLYDLAEAGCVVLQDAIITEGATHAYPLWNQLIYAATFDPNPEEIALELSQAWPGFDEDEVRVKLSAKQEDRKKNPNLGWPTCQQFNLVSPKCQECPHWGQIKSPFNLAKTSAYIADDKLVATNAGDLPDGYGRNDAGHVVGYVPTPGRPGEKQRAIVLPYKVRNGGLTVKDDQEVMLFEVEISGDWRLVTLPVSSAGSTRDFIGAVGQRGIAPSRTMQSHAQEFFLAWIKRLQEMRTRATAHHLGWDTVGFSYGEKLYRPGQVVPVYYSEMPQGYAPHGDLDPWKKLARFITGQKRPALDCVLASAFAAPLLKLGINRSVLLSIWGSETGQGKSLSMRCAQSVWGDPTIGINGLDDTKNSLMGKARLLRHLPLYWDELKTRDQYDKIITIVFELGQGKEKNRLGRNSKQLQIGSHQTMMTTASNHSLFSYVANNTAGTEAGGVRVFEIQVPPILLDASRQTDVWDMDRDIGANYGRAGEVYAAYLGEHQKRIEVTMSSIAKALSQSLTASVEERFWIATMASLIVGASIANAIGLTTFDVPTMKAFLEVTFRKLRKLMKTSVRVMRTREDAEAFLSQLVQNTIGQHLLFTDKVLDVGPGRPAKNAVQLIDVDARLRNPWLQLGRDDSLLRMVKHDLKKYVEGQGLNYDEVVDVLTRHFGAVEKRGIGTGLSGSYGALDKARAVCWQVTFPNHPSLPSSSSGSP